MTSEEAASLLRSRGLTDGEIAHVRAALRAGPKVRAGKRDNLAEKWRER